MGLDF
jgi:hypothetical protein